MSNTTRTAVSNALNTLHAARVVSMTEGGFGMLIPHMVSVTTKEIAEAAGVTQATARKHLLALGVRTRTKKFKVTPRKGGASKMTYWAPAK